MSSCQYFDNKYLIMNSLRHNTLSMDHCCLCHFKPGSKGMQHLNYNSARTFIQTLLLFLCLLENKNYVFFSQHNELLWYNLGSQNSHTGLGFRIGNIQILVKCEKVLSVHFIFRWMLCLPTQDPQDVLNSDACDCGRLCSFLSVFQFPVITLFSFQKIKVILYPQSSIFEMQGKREKERQKQFPFAGSLLEWSQPLRLSKSQSQHSQLGQHALFSQTH